MKKEGGTMDLGVKDLGVKLTEEQESVVDAVFSGNDKVILVNALAGTGKTTTCFAVMKEAVKRNLNVLYLVFNKTMANEAIEKAKKLGLNQKNVDIKTVHGFAYQQLAKRGYFKNKKIGSLKAKDISEIFQISISQAFCVLEFFNHFLFSNYNFDEIEKFVFQKIETSSYFKKKYEKVGEKLIDLLKKLIELLKSNKLVITHDFYLKEYVFSNHINHNFDIVILDESQDANPLFIELLKRLNYKKLLIIGDKHQRIYNFRNTVDAFKFFENNKTLYLTQTFRFGYNVAELANIVIKFKGEKKEIKAAQIPRKTNKPYAIISYTNSALLEHYINSKDKKTMTFEKDIKEIIKPVMSVLFLKYQIKNIDMQLIDQSIISSFKSYYDLEDYVEEIKNALYEREEEEEENVITDIELLKAYQLAQHFTLDDIYEVIDEYNKNKNETKLYYLTTAHSAKGLEYNMTFLLSDLAIEKKALQNYIEKKKNKQKINPEILTSINTLYVALTRATLQANINITICDTLEFMKNLTENQEENKIEEKNMEDQQLSLFQKTVAHEQAKNRWRPKDEEILKLTDNLGRSVSYILLQKVM